MSSEVIQGDCLEIMKGFPDNHFDSVVTDPPYGLEFMGKTWDGADGFRRSLNKADVGRDSVFGRTSRTSPEYKVTGAVPQSGRRPVSDQPGAHDEGYRNLRGKEPLFQAWCEQWAAECLRVLKPGGHLLAFGGTRTYHRMTCGIEDAGFEIRDSLHWIYGSGFPKSLDVSKAIDKAAGAEREILSQGKAVRRMIPGADQDRTGSWIKDNGREFVPTVTSAATEGAALWEGWGTALKPAHEPIVVARKPLAGTVAANVLEFGTGALNIDACRVEGIKDVPASPRRAAQGPAYSDLGNDPATGSGWDPNTGRFPPNILLSPEAAEGMDLQSGIQKDGTAIQRNRDGEVHNEIYGARRMPPVPDRGYEGSGGASRFFPCFRYQAKAARKERPSVEGVQAHPTVKPLELMRWLVRLVTPSGGVVLDPFAGSGTTGEAARIEGFRYVLIEREPDYIRLISKRMAQEPSLFDDWEVCG